MSKKDLKRTNRIEEEEVGENEDGNIDVSEDEAPILPPDTDEEEHEPEPEHDEQEVEQPVVTSTSPVGFEPDLLFEKEEVPDLDKLVEPIVEEPTAPEPAVPKARSKAKGKRTAAKPNSTLSELFQEVQHVSTTSLFKRFFVQLLDIYLSLDPDLFFHQLTNVILMLVQVKRKESRVDNSLKFLSQAFPFLNSKKVQGLELLCEKLVRRFFKGVECKDKFVRSRVVHLFSVWLDFLGPIQETFYLQLREKLSKRLHDKDTQVRVYTVLALSRLQAEEDPNEPDDLVSLLLQSLQYDASPEVRKAILTNVVQNERTIPFLIERSRDLDSSVRKQVFSKIMVEYGDFRALTIKQRESVLKAGVTDRDATVKKACNIMLNEVWMPLVSNDLVELLEKLDVMTSDVATLTLTAFFDNNQETCQQFQLPDTFFDALTVEGAYLAKAFIAYLHSHQLHEKFDSTVPTATEMVQYLTHYNTLAEQCKEEETKEGYDFIVQQLLEITTYVDLADEAGRRYLFELLRQLVVQSDCTQDQIRLLAQMFRLLAADEPDFIRTVVDLISDIQEKAGASLTPALLRQVEADLEQNESEVIEGHTPFLNGIHKCLVLVKFTLQLCEVTFVKNPVLSGILKDLIEPTANCDISALQDAGTECLGLCCLLDQRLAQRNLLTFMHSATNKSADLPDVRLANLKILFDIFCMYGIGPEFNLPPEKVQGFMKTVLKDTNPECLATAAQGITKLYLTGIHTDTEVLRRLIILYFIPSTAKNLGLRQCLHYFLEVFPRISQTNQSVLGETFVPTILEMVALHLKFAKRYSMVTPLQVGHQLADWTDPRKLREGEPSDGFDTIRLGAEPNDLHLLLAIQLLKATFDKDDAIRKLLLHTLARLAVETMQSVPKLLALNHLITQMFKENLPVDSVSTTTLTKLQNHCQKLIPKSNPNLKELSLNPIDLVGDVSIKKEGEDGLDLGLDLDLDPDAPILLHDPNGQLENPIQIKEEEGDVGEEVQTQIEPGNWNPENINRNEVKVEVKLEYSFSEKVYPIDPTYQSDEVYLDTLKFLNSRHVNEVYEVPPEQLTVPKGTGKPNHDLNQGKDQQGGKSKFYSRAKRAKK